MLLRLLAVLGAVRGAVVEVGGPAPAVTFHDEDHTVIFAELKGGEGTLNASTVLVAPDFLTASGTSVGRRLDELSGLDCTRSCTGASGSTDGDWGVATAWTESATGYVVNTLPPSGSYTRLSFACGTSSAFSSSYHDNNGHKAIGFKTGSSAAGDTKDTLTYGVYCSGAPASDDSALIIANGVTLTSPVLYSSSPRYTKNDYMQIRISSDGGVEWWKDTHTGGTLVHSLPASTVTAGQLPLHIFADIYNSQAEALIDVEYMHSVAN